MTPPGPKDFPFAPGRSAPPATPPPSSGIHEDPTVHLPPPVEQTTSLDPVGAEPVRRLGPYRLVRCLASGGMGSVWQGIDDALDRTVAIKVMAQELIGDSDAISRFQREAKATARIQHPHVAMIYMVGTTEDGSPFIAMEHVGGGTLDQLIRSRTPVSFAVVAGWMIQCCEALRAAQRESIIHRDIKPANIMLTEDGLVKVVDFGLARFVNEHSQRTVAGMVMGTPRYMSPEQAQGREVDYRSDMYSLGATFYHLMAGRPPFDGDTPMQIMMKHVTSPLPPMKSINPAVPMEFDDLMRRLMSKDPLERFLDYSDLVSELNRLKLQCTAREQGSFVMGPSTAAGTVRFNASGMPMAPDATASGAGRLAPAPDPAAEEERVPAWRYAVLGGAGVLVVIALGVAAASLLFGGDEAEAGADARPTGGLALLLDNIRRAQEAQNARMELSDDYLAFEATQEIVKELGRGLLQHQAAEGTYAPDLKALAAGPHVARIFDTDTLGRPLDAWGSRIEYIRDEQTVLSPGLDGRPYTDDDITCGINGVVVVRDQQAYMANMYKEMDGPAGRAIRNLPPDAF